MTDTILNVRDAEAIYRNAIEETRNSIIEVKGDTVSIPVSDFYKLNPLRTFAYELLSPYGFNLSNINDIIGLKDAIPGKEVQSSTHRLVRDRDLLIVVPKHKVSERKEYEITVNDIQSGITSPVHLRFEILESIPAKFDQPLNIAFIDLEKLEFPLQIRKWRRGDYFYPLGMSQRKRLSDFFIDLKYSKIDKEDQWLLCSGNEIIWVIGHRIDDRYKIVPGTRRILKITLF